MVWFRLKKPSESETGGQMGRGVGGGSGRAVSIVSTTEQAVDRARMKLRRVKPGPIKAKVAKPKNRKQTCKGH